MKITRAAFSRPHARTGFSTFLVFTVLTLVGAAFMSISTLFAHEMNRTREARSQTQLRQLLAAAIPAARQEIAAHGTTAREVNVPVPLEWATLVLHIAPSASGSEVSVNAALGKFKAAQTLAFSAGGELTDAELTQTH